MTPREVGPALTRLGAGAATLVGAAMLLTRVLRPSLEARRYAIDIRGATDGARGNLAALEGLQVTRERVAALRREVERIGVAS